MTAKLLTETACGRALGRWQTYAATRRAGLSPSVLVIESIYAVKLH